MNPYFKLLEDLIVLMETPQFGAVIADIKTIEGGHGTSLSTPGAREAAHTAIAIAQGLAAEPMSPVVYGPDYVGPTDPHLKS